MAIGRSRKKFEIFSLFHQSINQHQQYWDILIKIEARENERMNMVDEMVEDSMMMVTTRIKKKERRFFIARENNLLS